MIDFSDLSSCELLALGRRAVELCARRFKELAAASDPADRPVRELLLRMALDGELHAASVERKGNLLPEDSRLPSKPEEDLGMIRTYLTSLSKTLGEGPLHRDVALFLAESLEEEASRLFRVLAGHAREAQAMTVFSDLAEREQGNFHYLREVVLLG
jgi:rubrerythrin